MVQVVSVPASADRNTCVTIVVYADRKASSSSLEQLRRRAGEVGGSLSRKGSVERRAPPPPRGDLPHQLDTFKPIVITVTSFFKQVLRSFDISME